MKHYLTVLLGIVFLTSALVPLSADDQAESTLFIIDVAIGKIVDAQYTAPEDVYTQAIPSLDGGAVYITDNRQGPATTILKIMSDSGVIAAVVVTKIHEDFPQDDAILDRVVPRFERAPRHFRELIEINDVEENGHRAIIVSMIDEGYNRNAFPLGTTLRDENEPQSIGIHKLVSRDGYLIEFIVIVRGGDDIDSIRNNAMRHVADLMRGNSFTAGDVPEDGTD